jgi:MerR family transcriptional regulator, copper efflux regulator
MASSDQHRHLTIIGGLPFALPSQAEPRRTGDLGANGEEGDEGELFLIGEVAKATGKTVRAIHLYEDLGLLKPHERSKGRYRLFASDALVRVRWISKLQSLGLSLSAIQELVREQEGSDSAMFAAAKLRGVYSEKLEQTRQKIRELQLLETELEVSLAYLNSCDSKCEPQVPADSCTSCARHAESSDAPDLVAGAHAH